MRFPLNPIKLVDCEVHGIDSGAELFVVEGDSAALSVVRARNPQNQAVLPMQGKPLNAIKAKPRKVADYALFAALIEAMGTGFGEAFDGNKLRYERVLLLMDPDADGIHCGALMLMFFHRWMRPLLDTGRIMMVRAPVGEIRLMDNEERLFAHSDAQFQSLVQEHRPRDATVLRYRGLAGIDIDTLTELCIVAATRRAYVVAAEDAKAAIEAFGGA